MRISHRVDYGIRVMTAVTQLSELTGTTPVTRADLLAHDPMPPTFLVAILGDLRKRQLLRSQRGTRGGWALARPADRITVADVIRALDGPITSVRGTTPDRLAEHGDREPFVALWTTLGTAVSDVLDHVTIADLAHGELPADVTGTGHRPAPVSVAPVIGAA